VREFLCESRQTLLEVLRDVLGLTGTKEGCSNGNCGACTVLLDGKAINSCLVLAVEVEGARIETIEGMASGSELDPIQQASWRTPRCSVGSAPRASSCRRRRCWTRIRSRPKGKSATTWRETCADAPATTRLCEPCSVLRWPAEVTLGARRNRDDCKDSRRSADGPSGGGPLCRVIGTRPIRHDAVDKLTGRAKFGIDVHLPEMLHGAVLRSPEVHARIRSMDVSQAARVPGVRAIVTSADLPDPGDRVAELGEGSVVLRHLSHNVLARAKVLYRGHAVAAVAADSSHLAEEAARQIRVDYEVLPAVLDSAGGDEGLDPLAAS